MLEVVNLSKIYKSKGGTEVKALDDVSLRFPETGMVFLLGKSGSGKSTLLNVCGGLDSPTSGEIIVKGRSSKDFTQGDFDSYRNTFIGFIFQEYNILNEFTVEDNIALALELQGKPKDKATIDALLKEVDLEGLAKRRPNTLSGGQKQRIAIARALIKSPEIIMADEPTGALDSNTGKQVFETLKKLSRSKLVIVVSHDRDFAEQYGDRIIELKDGKILSDVSKTSADKKQISENVTLIGDTICVKSGKELTDSEFEQIKSFLRDSKKDVVISNGESEIKAFKEATRITDDGDKEVFKDTDEGKLPKKDYKPEDSKFIRSKLPLRHAVKIGTSNLKTKPFRLIFTILLCVVAFTLLGVLSTMMLYDSDATFKQTLKDTSPSHVRFEKTFWYHEKSYYEGEVQWEGDSTTQAPFSKDDVEALKQKLGKEVFGVTSLNSSISLNNNRNDYYQGEILYIANNKDASSLKLVYGNIPTKNNDIVISSYLADVIVNCKAYDPNGSLVDVSSPDMLIGKSISLGFGGFTICGIFDSGAINPKYDVLKDENAEHDEMLEYSFYNDLREGLHFVVIVSESAQSIIASNYQNFYYDPTKNSWTNGAFTTENEPAMLGMGSYYYKIGDAGDDVVYLGNQTSLGDGEVVVSYKRFASFAFNLLEKDRNKLYEEHNTKYNQIWELRQNAPSNEKYFDKGIDFDSYYNNWDILLNPSYSKEEKESAELYIPSEGDILYDLYVEFSALTTELYELQEERDKYDSYYRIYESLYNDQIYNEDKGYRSLTIEERKEYLNTLTQATDFSDFKVLVSAVDNESYEPLFNTATSLKVVGYAGIEQTGNPYNDQFYVTDSLYNEFWNEQKETTQHYSEYTTSYVPPRGATYSCVFASYDSSNEMTEQLLSIYKNKEFSENDTKISLTGGIFDGLKVTDDMIESLSKIFLIVGIIIAVFACLLLSNFISMSISNKKREIGILRAVGARGSDVFKIFFSESFVITLICTALSVVASIALCIVLNMEVSTSIGASIFNFGILSFIIIVALALLTAVIATFLPVRNAAKKKPVESIRAL